MIAGNFTERLSDIFPTYFKNTTQNDTKRQIEKKKKP